MMSEPTARTAVITGPEMLEVRDLSLPQPGADDVLVAVEACGICGSNLHEWRHPDRRLTAGAEPAPGAAGHEVVARVLAADVSSGWSPGDRAVIEPNRVTACGRCTSCVEGVAWFCRDRREVPSWGFATHMVVPRRSLFPVPEGLPADVATLVEPTACVVHALRHSWSASRLLWRLDDLNVTILGAGVTGLLAIAAARYLGARSIAITARHPQQVRAAAALGADLVIDASGGDVVDRLRAHGADVTLEAVGGRADTFDLACRTTAARGEVVVLGLFDAPVTIDARRAVFRELRTFFPVTYATLDGIHDFEVALAVLAGLGGTAGELVTHRFPLDAVSEAFSAAATKRDGALRVLVTPGTAIADR